MFGANRSSSQNRFINSDARAEHPLNPVFITCFLYKNIRGAHFLGMAVYQIVGGDFHY